MKARATKKTKGKTTEVKVVFKLIQRTVLPKSANKIIETNRGQNEVWIAKKGDVNTIKY